jgi:hypothetical protein
MKVDDHTIVTKEKAAYTLHMSDDGYKSIVYDPTYQGHRLASRVNTKKANEDSTKLNIDITDDGITDDDLLGLSAIHNDFTYVHINETLNDDLTSLFVTDDQLSLDDDLDDTIQQLALTAISAVSAASIYVPRNYAEAMKTPQASGWHKATYIEHDSLVEKKVFKIVLLPKDAKTISSKLVFKAKPTPTGDLAKLKACVVAHGFQQRQGLDYNETFSPTARATSIRILLAICVLLGWISAQSDVYVAFLNATLRHKIYVISPPPFQLLPGHAWLLLKSLYGLVQAPREWYDTLTAKLIEMGFCVSLFDPCVYIHTRPLIISVHVDDIRIYAADQSTIDVFRDELSQAFAIASEDPDALYLGMHIEQGPDSIKIHQSEYVRRLLERFQVDNIPIAPTPCNHQDKLRRENDEIATPAMRKEYLQKLGSLNYLPAMTRIDIAYAAPVYGRYNANPTQLHLDGITRAYAYAKGTQNVAITYTRQDAQIIGYCDADWAGCLDTRRSTTGYMFTLAGGPISWSSAVQKVVAQSTCEAEYMALGEAVKEALWIKDFINNLGLPGIHFNTVPIHVDNESAVKLAKNPEFHQRSKHIDIRHHFLRDNVRQGTIKVIWISGKEYPADMLTKALYPVKFSKICCDISLLP